jgi:lysozyme family protein
VARSTTNKAKPTATDPETASMTFEHTIRDARILEDLRREHLLHRVEVFSPQLWPQTEHFSNRRRLSAGKEWAYDEISPICGSAQAP